MVEIEPQQQRADLGLPLVEEDDESPREVSVEDTAGGTQVGRGSSSGVQE